MLRAWHPIGVIYDAFFYFFFVRPHKFFFSLVPVLRRQLGQIYSKW